MFRWNARFLAVGLALWIGGAACAQQMPSSALIIAPTETSGMFGITAGQTARLNALNPGVPAPLATGARCSVQVSFLDDQGNVLKTVPVTVDPGKSTAVDFVMSSAGRLEVRAVITFSQPAPVANPSTGASVALPVALLCRLVPSLEIIDTDSKTVAASMDFRFLSYGFLPGLMGTTMPSR